MTEERVYIRFPGPEDAAELLGMYLRNREFLKSIRRRSAGISIQRSTSGTSLRSMKSSGQQMRDTTSWSFTRLTAGSSAVSVCLLW